jgi:hypothetical protein
MREHEAILFCLRDAVGYWYKGINKDACTITEKIRAHLLAQQQNHANFTTTTTTASSGIVLPHSNTTTTIIYHHHVAAKFFLIGVIRVGCR